MVALSKNMGMKPMMIMKGRFKSAPIIVQAIMEMEPTRNPAVRTFGLFTKP